MKKNSYTYDELISCANGELFGPGNAKLPAPPMLMFDRITEISENKGEFGKGKRRAVHTIYEVTPDALDKKVDEQAHELMQSNTNQT